jgi:hypothetical protein
MAAKKKATSRPPLLRSFAKEGIGSVAFDTALSFERRAIAS